MGLRHARRNGQAVKLVNQLLCSVNLVAATEALAFAGKLGLDQAQVLNMLETGAAASWMLADRGPRMLCGTEVEVTSAVDIFLKESGLVMEATRELGLHAPRPLSSPASRFRSMAAFLVRRVIARAEFGAPTLSHEVSAFRPYLRAL